MPLPAHVGLEHPSLFWLVVVAILAFAAGLGVNLVRSTDEGARQDPAAGDEDPE